MRHRELLSIPLLAASLAACGETSETSETGQSGAGDESSAQTRANIGRQDDALDPPETVVDGKGRRWIRKVKVTYSTQEMVEPKSKKKIDVRTLTDEQLAAKLTPVALYKDWQYELSVSQLQLARDIKSGVLETSERGSPPSQFSGATEGSGSQAQAGAEAAAAAGDDPTSDVIFGADNREKRRDNTKFPFSAQVRVGNASITGGGSATMIGPSTALSAAHVFVNSDTGKWLTTRTWAPGMDRQDGTSVNDPAIAPFGQFTGCYWVVVRKGYLEDQDFTYDYAVVEFSNMYDTCNLKPGNQTGWMGWMHAKKSRIEGSSFFALVYGYPAQMPYPQIWGMGQIGGFDVDGTDEIQYDTIDTVGGQSGAALYNFWDGNTNDRRVVGVHTGSYTDFTTVNRSRRIDGSVVDAIFQWSAL